MLGQSLSRCYSSTLHYCCTIQSISYCLRAAPQFTATQKRTSPSKPLPHETSPSNRFEQKIHTPSKMSAAHSSLLQTAIQNLQISQQAKDRDDSRSSKDFNSPQSDLNDLPSEDEGEGDEFVNVGQGTRPPTRPTSPKPKKVALRPDSSRLSDADDSIDPVS